MLLALLLKVRKAPPSPSQQSSDQGSSLTSQGVLFRGALTNLAHVLMMAAAVIYYATDRCSNPGEIVSIVTHKPLRYLLAGFQFVIVAAVGLLLCIIPGILVILASPLYVH